MINEDLVAEIQSRYLRGHKSMEIKKDLIKSGLSEKEVDDAISYLHRQALKQIPVVSFLLNLWENFEAKVANMSPRSAVVVLASMALLLVVIGVGLYMLLDPLNIKSGSRDEQRNAAVAQIQSALDNYYSQTQSYPSSLSELVPNYLKSVPKDPRTREAYEYQLLNGGYELCIKYEIKPVECVSGAARAGASVADMDSLVPEVSEEPGGLFTINGLVFIDRNNDKIRQNSELPNASVIVTVADQDGNKICEEVTDENGTFACSVSNSGMYYVFMDATETLEVLGVNPQKIIVPAEDSVDGSANVVLRTNNKSNAKTSSSAPVPSESAPIQ